MYHIPILRAGQPYESLTKHSLVDFRTGEPVASISQANPGLIAKDLRAAEANRRKLQSVSISELLKVCAKVADLFMQSDLPIGDDLQSPEDYVRALSRTSGMPQALCRKNMVKIESVLRNMPGILTSLTRGLDLTILDSGWSTRSNSMVSYFGDTNALGVVLPSNSPGVHGIWLPAIPLKVPLVLKPGREEPWTPMRICQAFVAAGCPREAFSYYPTDHSGATEILLHCGRSLLFGDVSTIGGWKNDPRIELHGPGWSKVLIAADEIDRWKEYLDLMVASIVENGGRSCINASGVWLTGRGKEIAEALAQRLAKIQPTSAEDPDAQLAAFTNPKFAEKLNDLINSQLRILGAEDLTAKYRDGKRLVEKDGAKFLLPTIVWCTDASHPLTKAEFLFPFATVVELPEDQILSRIGHTLVLSAITKNEGLIRQLLSSRQIDRLNLGPVPTTKVSWDQPHEGNLFEHLYRRRALQFAGA
jgi:acyl-CoA reductase-like NAD-dependent aldehyde dehydrogenase